MKLSSQERLIKVVEALVETGFHGASNKELAIALQITPAAVCRDLATLRSAGWAERKEDGTHRMGPLFGNFAGVIARTFRQARLDLQREEERY